MPVTRRLILGIAIGVLFTASAWAVAGSTIDPGVPGVSGHSCVLNGDVVTPTCTATVPTGSGCACTHTSASIARAISCSVSGTTMTAVSAITLDSGTVSAVCVR